MSTLRILTLQVAGTLGTSNPVTTRLCHGGAARNVARYLARLSVPCKLLGLVGDDAEGRALILETSQQNVDTGLVQKSLSRPTASCTTVRNPDGELFASFADMEICGSMNRSFIQNRWIQIGNAALVFVDAHVPADTLAFLIAGCREQGLTLVVDAVSTVTAAQLPLNLHGVDLLVSSIDEASIILGNEITADPESLAAALCQRGAANTVITGGAGGIWFANADGPATLFVGNDAPAGPIGDREAFIAGTIYGRLKEHDPMASLCIGARAAALVANPDDPDAAALTAAAVTAGIE
jgi:pseudouridine kinase